MTRLAPGLRAATLGLLLLAPLATRAWAQASAPAPVSETRRQASRKFLEGTRAFDAGDFTRAGEAFEAAYALAPHPDALWNGARAWQLAGELARAANLYARYLREAPPDAPDRTSAQAAVRQLGARLARIELQRAAGVSDVRVDGTPVDAPAVYVVPGAHVLRAQGAGGPIEQSQTLRAGDDVSVLLAEAPPPPVPGSARAEGPSPVPAPTTALPAPIAPSATPEPAPSRTGWSPTVVLVGAGVSLALAGVATWSGLDTLDTLHAFDAHPTQGSLDAGRAEELRTNVLIAASAGLALLTVATAVFWVDWHGARAPRVGLGAGPACATVAGEF